MRSTARKSAPRDLAHATPAQPGEAALSVPEGRPEKLRRVSGKGKRADDMTDPPVEIALTNAQVAPAFSGAGCCHKPPKSQGRASIGVRAECNTTCISTHCANRRRRLRVLIRVPLLISTAAPDSCRSGVHLLTLDRRDLGQRCNSPWFQSSCIPIVNSKGKSIMSQHSPTHYKAI